MLHNICNVIRLCWVPDTVITPYHFNNSLTSGDPQTITAYCTTQQDPCNLACENELCNNSIRYRKPSGNVNNVINHCRHTVHIICYCLSLLYINRHFALWSTLFWYGDMAIHIPYIDCNHPEIVNTVEKRMNSYSFLANLWGLMVMRNLSDRLCVSLTKIFSLNKTVGIIL